MSKFTFRLEPIVRLRLAERDRCRVALAESLARAQEISHRREALASELATVDRTRLVSRGVVDLAKLSQAADYAELLRRDQADCEQELAALAEEIAARRNELLTVDREVRMLERLRERQQAQFQAVSQRQEQRVMDEVAANRHRTADL